MLPTPFYDPLKTYEENYKSGPYGEFSNRKKLEQKGEPKYEYLGQKVYLPFGIPAGPLINSNFVRGAFEKGFDIAVYKTVRSSFFPCHPFPNVLAIHPQGDLTLDELSKSLIADAKYEEPLSITNSFGVPSKEPETWQEDVEKAISYGREGQVLVLSFMGTVKKDQTQQEFINDYILAAKLSLETGAKILETNLSCPNIGNEGLVCYNLDVTQKIAKGIREIIGNTPLVLKVGYYKDESQMEKLAQIANEYADAVAGINTLQGTIVNEKGDQALPGPNRLKSGVCGSGIKWAGIDFVKRLNQIKRDKNYKFAVDGVGGVTKPSDYNDYAEVGANAVFSATGAMWNPNLAKEIKSSL